MKTIDMLITEIKNSEALQKLLAQAVKNNALAAFLKEQGCEATAEEFIAALKAAAEQMDDTALDAVAGGANAEEAWISILSCGICCAIEAINSSKRKDKEWGDGRILCDDC
ncbi:MAG: hypothetical protein J6M56_10245 [Clostridia bacterium]|nr:hypothetical protein [Clostridia bacterium]MBQ2835068.1 hypothetical protein [Clostridia bacterium]